MIAYEGPSELQNPQSIMAFDRWVKSGKATIERHGGNVIDGEALRFLLKLYPHLPTVFSTRFVNSQQFGFKPNIGHVFATHRYNTRQTENVITGLNRLDMGLNSNVRITSFVEARGDDFFDVTQGCWADTHIYDASCDVMSFTPGDTRVQTGSAEYRNWKQNGPNSQDSPGVTLERRIEFARPWKQTPKVVAFISGLDYGQRGENIRVNVVVPGELVNTTGFTMRCEVWAGELLEPLESRYARLTYLQTALHIMSR
jgi:hypothetical protein